MYNILSGPTLETAKTAERRNLVKRFAILTAMTALAAGAALRATASEIPWASPTYTLVARDMNLRSALETFASSQRISVVMTDGVQGSFSGDFRNVPSGEFLRRITTVHNLTWYYDGTALYIYTAGEVQTLLIDLKYMKAGEVRNMIAELGVEDSRFPLKTTSNDELIMVSGPPRYVALVAEMISKADKLRETRSFNDVETRIFPLVNTWADDVSFRVSSPESSASIKGVARLLDEMMNAGSGSGKTSEAAITNEFSTFEAAQMGAYRPVIRPENRINAVIVRDVSSRMPMYERVIKELDVPQKLIEIAVTTVELSQKDALDWQLSLSLSTTHGHSDIGVGQNAANLFQPAELVGRGLAGAITHIHSAYALSSSLTALRERGKARNISRTSLLTVNNLAAEMTDSQSYHARIAGKEVAELEEVSAGTKLQIKPRIVNGVGTNAVDQVWLSMRLDDGGFESVTVDSMPMTRTTTLQTQTALFENDSIMLAGYLRDIEEEAGWGIPLLRDIPFIGWLFGGKTVRKETVQRMFILTPHIVDLDAEMLARLQSTRLRDIEEMDELQDDADVVDDKRKLRDEERKARRQKREEETEDALFRRRAELKHEKTMRLYGRIKEKRLLSEDIRRMKAEEEAAEARLREEADEEVGKIRQERLDKRMNSGE